MSNTYTPPRFAGERPDKFWAWQEKKHNPPVVKPISRNTGSYTPPSRPGERQDLWYLWRV